MGGVLLAHRGTEGAVESQTAAAALKVLGGAVDGVKAYHLPGLERTRHLVRVVKTNPTPAEYPRRDGVPAKRPLQ